MKILEITRPHQINKFAIKKDDLRFDLYRNAIENYSSDSKKLSDMLHRFYRNPNQVLGKKRKEEAQMLDDIMFNHPIKQNLIVYYGIRESPLRIWIKYNVSFDKSVTVHFPGFISSSTTKHVAKKFSIVDRYLPNRLEYFEAKRNILVIDVPAGTPGLSIKQFSKFESENEILLSRGLDIKIYPKPKLTERNFLYWRAEVVGHNPQEIIE